MQFLNTWQGMGILGVIFVTVSRLLRKQLYNKTKTSYDEGWFYILFGLTITALSHLIYCNFKDTSILKKLFQIKPMKKGDNFLSTYRFPLYIFSGILIYITFFLFNKSLIVVDNPGFLVALYSGLGISLAYIFSLFLFNEKATMKDIIAVTMITIGIYVVST